MQTRFFIEDNCAFFPHVHVLSIDVSKKKDYIQNLCKGPNQRKSTYRSLYLSFFKMYSCLTSRPIK